MKKIYFVLLSSLLCINLVFGQANLTSFNRHSSNNEISNTLKNKASKNNLPVKVKGQKSRTDLNPTANRMAPVNNNACSAIMVVVDGGAVTGDNLLATAQNNEVVPPHVTSCFANNGWCEGPPVTVDNSVWYKFVVPVGGAVTISTCNGAGSFDTQLAVWDPVVCNNFSSYIFIGGNDDGTNCTTTYTSFLSLLGLTVGDTLWVQLDGYGGDEGTFDLEINTLITAVNDQPCNAIAVAVGGSAGTFTLDNAYADPNENAIVPPESDCISNEGWCELVPTINNSVWFTFTAPLTGAVSISTCNSAVPFDTQLALYEVGTCSDYSTYSLLAANDDGDTTLCITSVDFYTSYLAICGLIPGNTYYLMVDGYNGASGDFDLAIDSFTPSLPTTAAVSSLAPSCVNGNNGVAVVTTTGGFGPYQSLWSNGFIGSSLISNPGTYSVTVTDRCGNTSTASATIPSGTNTLTVLSGNTLHICDGTPVTLSASANGGIPNDTVIQFTAYDLTNGSLIKFGLGNLTTPQIITTGNTEAYFAGELTPTGYFVIDNNTSELVQLELVSGSKSVLGKLAVKNGHTWSGMAWDNTGNTLYAVSTNGIISTLYTINTATATSTIVADITGAPITIWLTCSPGGNLFTFDLGTDSVYTLDKLNGNATSLSSIGFDANFAQGADFDDVSGTLYLAAYNGTSMASELYSIDTLSGVSTFIGTLSEELDAFVCMPYITGDAFLYSWLPATGLSATNIANPVANPTATTIYTVTITDACGNTSTSTQEVTVSNLVLTTTKTDVTLFGGSDGTATTTLTGGALPLTYLWSNGSTTANLSNIIAGTYTVTVTDANGCSKTGSVTVNQPPSNTEDIATAGFYSFTISPNPSTGKILLHAKTLRKSTLEIQVYSASGKLIASYKETPGIKFSRSIDLETAGKGTYFIQLKTNIGIYSHRVFIQ